MVSPLRRERDRSPQSPQSTQRTCRESDRPWVPGTRPFTTETQRQRGGRRHNRPMLAALALLLAITPNAIRAHITFLASDTLEGRETGTRGYDVAAAYVAAQFEALGAEPAGDDGTYLQQLRMRTFLLDPA